jgi:hypothetical protein
MVGKYLSLTFANNLVAVGECLDNQAALGWPIALPGDILVGAQVPDHQRQRVKHCQFVLRESHDCAEL